MHDGAIPTSRVITIGLWSLTATTFAVAVVVTALGGWQAGNLVGHGACCLSAAAAVSHIRCIALRASRYIRSAITMEAERKRQPNLRTI